MSLQQTQLQNPITEEYTTENARVIVKLISLMSLGLIETTVKQGQHFVQTYSLSKGLKTFGEKGRQAAYNEMKQLHQRMVFEPINYDDLTSLEKSRAMESLIFLK
jgi:hypothetical protein